MQKGFGAGQWSFLGPGSERKWDCISEDSPQGVWDNMAARMLLEFAENGCPIFRATSPLSAQKQRWSVFTEQSQKCVKNVTPATMIEQGDLLWKDNPTFVPSVMKTNIPLTDGPAQEEDLLQRYRERIEKLSQQDRVSKFCSDAGFLTTVEVGQYFMTKDTEELSQFTDSVACREYTLPRNESSSETQGWIRGNT